MVLWKCLPLTMEWCPVTSLSTHCHEISILNRPCYDDYSFVWTLLFPVWKKWARICIEWVMLKNSISHPDHSGEIKISICRFKLFSGMLNCCQHTGWVARPVPFYFRVSCRMMPFLLILILVWVVSVLISTFSKLNPSLKCPSLSRTFSGYFTCSS